MAPPDSHHLAAAQGWLGLGNYLEANEELEKIAPAWRAHPSVLFVRWEIYGKAKKWDAALVIAESLIRLVPEEPSAWIHRSFSARVRITLAGLPNTTVLAGTSFVTTDPAPTNAPSPMVNPGRIVAFEPMLAPRRTKVLENA